jgi:hypothetical protein
MHHSKFFIRTSAELNRVAIKAATTTMETTILTVVERAVILNVVSSFTSSDGDYKSVQGMASWHD